MTYMVVAKIIGLAGGVMLALVIARRLTGLFYVLNAFALIGLSIYMHVSR